MKLSIEQKAFGGKIPGLLDIAEAQVVAACDVDSWRLNKAKETIEAHYAKNAAKGTFKGCAIYQDFRDIINRKDIDAIKTNRKTLEIGRAHV